MIKLNFKRHRFPPEIIRHSIWLYARFTLSFRDVDDEGEVLDFLVQSRRNAKAAK